MANIPREWQPIIADLKHEIQTTHTARSNRKRLNNPALLEFWDEYLAGLRFVYTKLLLHCPTQSPAEYAEARTPPLELSNPPRWTDFFKPSIKAEMRGRQAAFLPTTRAAYKQVFDHTRRAARGAAKVAKFWRGLDADRAQAQRVLADTEPDNPNHQRAQRELHYMALMEAKFKARELKSQAPKSWLEMLSKEELRDMWRDTETDDTPIDKDVTAAVPAVVDMASVDKRYKRKPKVESSTLDKPKRGRGRPFGVKDTVPRIRSPQTPIAQLMSARKREKKRAYEQLQVLRDQGIDPYADVPKESTVDLINRMFEEGHHVES